MDLKQLEIRSFSPEQDIPPLLSLYLAVEGNDHSGNQVNEEYLRRQLDSPGHDPAQDRWVVGAPDDRSSFIGAAMVKLSPGSDNCEANIVVHPAWRHKGVGSALLSRVSERAGQLNAADIEIFASSSQVETISFLQKRSFTARGAYTELRLDQRTKLPPVIWPYGYTMRPYSDVQDISILTEAMNQCYIPLWGHQEVSETDMHGWLPGFSQPGLFLVFSEKGRVVGISRTEPSPERSQKNGVSTGYIDAPGVVPQHRRLDLYRALVLTGVDWLRSQGQVIVEMESWGDKLEILKMYRELGFKDIRQLICYRLELKLG